MLGLALALVMGCGETVTVEDDRCELDVASVEPVSASPGDTVVASGEGPFINERDTALFLAGTRAQVIEVNGETDDCAQCLQCRLEADCSVCDTTCTGGGDQDGGRIVECFAEMPTDTGEPLVAGLRPGSYCSRCDFRIEFVVPDVPPGPTEIWAVGEIGTSQPVPFEVEAPASTTTP